MYFLSFGSLLNKLGHPCHGIYILASFQTPLYGTVYLCAVKYNGSPVKQFDFWLILEIPERGCTAFCWCRQYGEYSDYVLTVNHLKLSGHYMYHQV
jgi:hypothetical protein